ncbi:hypothetical protein BDQ12DRAFT_700569 [Crucibulum laeve]|uniref:Uncharacterized protein n=1 Tax=Crucibulum laeve TaxID=68775 RepID=A0A5C3LP12_9AGAR|nr:hypothetical protein BDQ12DRAFT_700569 [Crucibulum laeve]
MWTPFYLFISFFLQAQAILVNVTVDDSGINPLTGQPIIYNPPGAWNLGANCTMCTAKIDARDVHNGTWHDVSTFNSMLQLQTASLVFNGTAVYVSCAIARTTSSPHGFSDMSFFIDGNLVGTFVKTPPGLPGYDFNFTVYSNTSLPPGRHELTIQNSHINGSSSLILLDSITYSSVLHTPS